MIAVGTEGQTAAFDHLLVSKGTRGLTPGVPAATMIIAVGTEGQTAVSENATAFNKTPAAFDHLLVSINNPRPDARRTGRYDDHSSRHQRSDCGF